MPPFTAPRPDGEQVEVRAVVVQLEEVVPQRRDAADVTAVVVHLDRLPRDILHDQLIVHAAGLGAGFGEFGFFLFGFLGPQRGGFQLFFRLFIGPCLKFIS